jgi:WD40 repeat protein
MEGTGPVKWNLRLAAANRGIWKASELQKSLPRTLMVGPAGPVDSVAFSADKRTMASSGVDGTVQLWDVADPANPRPLGKPLAPGGKAAEVSSAAISPDGRTLVAGDDAGTMQLWDISHPTSPRALGEGADLGDVLGGVLRNILGGRAGTGPLSDPMYSVAFSPRDRRWRLGTPSA